MNKVGRVVLSTVVAPVIVTGLAVCTLLFAITFVLSTELIELKKDYK